MQAFLRTGNDYDWTNDQEIFFMRGSYPCVVANAPDQGAGLTCRRSIPLSAGQELLELKVIEVLI